MPPNSPILSLPVSEYNFAGPLQAVYSESKGTFPKCRKPTRIAAGLQTGNRHFRKVLFIVSDSLKIQTFEHLMTTTEEVKWLIEGLIPKSGTGFIAGKFSSGKSWITQDLVLAIATGTKWLGHFPTDKGTVLVIDEENAQTLLKSRYDKLLKGRGVKSYKIPLHYSVKSRMNFSAGRDGKPSAIYTSLCKWCEQYKPALIVCDSLTRVHRNNEDKANEMSAVFRNVDEVVNRYNTTILFTHHAPHNGDRMRGSVDIYGFADWSIFVNKHGKAPKEYVTVAQDKGRWDREVEPFKVIMNGSDDSFRVLHAGVTTEKNALDKESQAIVSVLKDGPVERSECIEKSGIYKSTFDRRRVELIERGLVVEAKSGGKIMLALPGNSTSFPFTRKGRK